MGFKSNINIISAYLLTESKTEFRDGFHKGFNDIASEGYNSFTAESENTIIEIKRSPAYESEGHCKSFTASNSTVTDNSIIMTIFGRVPPFKSNELFF